MEEEQPSAAGDGAGAAPEGLSSGSPGMSQAGKADRTGPASPRPVGHARARRALGAVPAPRLPRCTPSAHRLGVGSGAVPWSPNGGQFYQ